MRRAGSRQRGDIPGVTPFLVSHETHSSTFGLPPPWFLSIRKTEKLSDGVTAVSGTEGMSHVSVKQMMLQSLMSRWKLILALRSSILFSKDWTVSPFPRSVANTSAISTVFLVPSPMAFVLSAVRRISRGTMDTDSVIKCPEPD